MNQPNVTVLTGALATKVLFEGKRAVGLEFLYNNQLLQVKAAKKSSCQRCDPDTEAAHAVWRR